MSHANAPGHRYAEYTAPHLPQVEAFWSLDAGTAPHRVLPDGCMDFIFNLDQARAILVGTMTACQVVTLSAGARLFGVRFAPGAGVPFIDAPAAALTDADTDLIDLTRAARFHLLERVVEAPNHAARVRVVTQFLREPLARIQVTDTRLRNAVFYLRERRGCIGMADLAEQLDLSPRQLERLFQHHVGASPKFIARVLRMQHALRLLEAPAHYRGSHALVAGYADEPHLVREFRSLTGLSPRQLVQERRVAFVQPPPRELV